MKQFLIEKYYIYFGIVNTKNVLPTKIKLFLTHVTKCLQYLSKTIFVLISKLLNTNISWVELFKQMYLHIFIVVYLLFQNCIVVDMFS